MKPRTPRLPAAEVRKRLATLPRWRVKRAHLCRTFVFRDFTEAFAFMTRVALLAEKREHHPDWSNSWNEVVIELTSHDAKGLSARDFDLALAIDELAPGR